MENNLTNEVEKLKKEVWDLAKNRVSQIEETIENLDPETLQEISQQIGDLSELTESIEGLSSDIQTLQSSKVDVVSGKGLSTNDYTTDEKTKLSGISAGAEVNVQSNWNESDSSSDAFIQNKPSIPSVSNKKITFTQGGVSKGNFTLNQSVNSTIALDAGGVQSDWNESDSTSMSYILNKPTIPSAFSDLSDDSTHRVVTDTEKSTWNAKSDFSGSYTDLTNKPSIPSVSNKKITFTQGGVSKGNFTLNQSVNSTIALDAQTQTNWNESDSTSTAYIQNKPTIPSSLSDLSDDSTHRVVTDTEKSAWNAKSDFSGSYTDLTNKPSIPSVSNKKITFKQGTETKGNFTLNQSVNSTITFDAQVQANWNESDSTSKAYILNKPSIPASLSDLSGSYSDISGAPQFSYSNGVLTITI